MKIAIESPEKLTDNDVEDIVDTWSRKCRRIAVYMYVEPFVTVLCYVVLYLLYTVHIEKILATYVPRGGGGNWQGGRMPPHPSTLNEPLQNIKV